MFAYEADNENSRKCDAGYYEVQVTIKLRSYVMIFEKIIMHYENIVTLCVRCQWCALQRPFKRCSFTTYFNPVASVLWAVFRRYFRSTDCRLNKIVLQRVSKVSVINNPDIIYTTWQSSKNMWTMLILYNLCSPMRGSNMIMCLRGSI